MQVIQTIRDKGAAIVIVVIALSLIGFLLMDAKSGNASLFGGSVSSDAGKVNGMGISRQEYDYKYAMYEKSAQGRISPDQVEQAKNFIWDNIIKEKILRAEGEKLGIGFTSDELSSLLYSTDPMNPIKDQKQYFDSLTNKPDPAKIKELILEIKKTKGLTPEQKQQRAQQDEGLNNLAIQAIEKKYNTLLSASAYYATWMQERDKKEAQKYATISYVQLPYSLVPDSTITVSDKEVEAYVAKNKSRFKQEAGRMISYVSFSTLPTSADSNNILTSLNNLKTQFATDTNARLFVGRNSSSVPFFDGYVTKSAMKMPEKDAITGAGLNNVYGPYMDGGSYVLSKIIGQKTMPDSVKCRHILIGTSDPQTGQPLISDSAAKRLCDSIAGVIRGGGDFVTMSNKFSTDEVAKKDKGEMTFDIATIQGSGFAKEFADFILNDKGETKKVVKTQFGYHYIEILKNINPGPAFKIAYMARQIVPGQESLSASQRGATQLSAQCRNLKQLDAYLAKNGLQKINTGKLLKENDVAIENSNYMMQSQPPNARQIVQWAFSAKEGEVSSETYPYGDAVIVPVLEAVYKEGTMRVKDARPLSEAAVRNQKKAEIITKKAGTTLESAAAAYPGIPGVEIKQAGADSSITYNAGNVPGIGYEPKVIGTIFSKDATTKTSTVAGNQAVYAVKVNGYADKNIPQSQQEQQATFKPQTLRQQQYANAFGELKKQADIKDKRNSQ